MDFTTGLLVGAVLAGALAAIIHFYRRRAPAARISVGQGGLEGLRRVGELVVLRAFWTIPAQGENHIFGETGLKFLRWLWSENKTIMIFRFEIRFKYNLSDTASVALSRVNPEVLAVVLGKPAHEIALSDVQFYHTQQGKLLDWLLPSALNFFRSDMDDKTRQAIMQEARANAKQEAEQLAAQLEGDARAAESTLTALGRSAGFSEVRFTGV